MFDIIAPAALISLIIIGAITVGYTLYSILEEIKK